MLLAPMAAQRRGADRLDGQRHARSPCSRDRQPPLFSLLQAALRAGHQPADRPDPRGDRDERRHRRRLRAQPARRSRPSTRTSSSMQTPILRDRELQRLRHVDSSIFSRAHARHHVAGRRGPGRHGARARARLRARPTRRRRRRQHPDPVRPRASAPSARRSRRCSPSARVHHHLVREGTRLQTGLVIESGEPREVHHFATLIGYGAGAINPYLMFESLGRARRATAASRASTTSTTAAARTWSRASPRACSRRSPRWGSRRSSPTTARRSSRPSASRRRWSTRYFTGTASRIGGIGRRGARAGDARAPRARRIRRAAEDLLPVGGVYAWRRDGEHHLWNPETIALLQHAVRHGGQPTYDEFAKLVNEDAARRATLRGLLQFNELPEDEWLPLDEVEPAAEIVKRFATGAMSLGSLSREAHETLAIAMNRHRRQVEHRRGRRGSGPLTPRRRTATAAARRSSRSRPAASA